ncbi:MAG TPA: hypothetical protein PLA71_00345 [Saccharofermentans sp.]|mgnify:CR=1 FL=1|nr:hypothetical protein [Saccharofermentans sp.]
MKKFMLVFCIAVAMSFASIAEEVVPVKEDTKVEAVVPEAKAPEAKVEEKATTDTPKVEVPKEPVQEAPVASK